jgi:hypothetical protein
MSNWVKWGYIAYAALVLFFNALLLESTLPDYGQFSEGLFDPTSILFLVSLPVSIGGGLFAVASAFRGSKKGWVAGFIILTLPWIIILAIILHVLSLPRR